MASIVFVAMEDYETRKDHVPSSPRHDRAHVLPAETPTEVGVVAEVETPLASVSSDVPQRAAKVRTKACVRGKEASEVATFGDRHLLTLMTSGSDSKIQPRYPTGAVAGLAIRIP